MKEVGQIGPQALFVAACLFLPFSTLGYAHGVHRGIPNMGDQPVEWRTDQIVRVMTFNTDREVGRIVTLDGKRCLEGRTFSFDVDDKYAFDIDEIVELEVEFYQHREPTAPEVRYEKNGDAEVKVQGEIPGYKGGPRVHKATFALERARFANRGLLLTDFSIALPWGSNAKLTICNISLKRSYTTVAPKDFGAIAVVECPEDCGHRRASK
jgi:hypothetical protein